MYKFVENNCGIMWDSTYRHGEVDQKKGWIDELCHVDMQVHDK